MKSLLELFAELDKAASPEAKEQVKGYNEVDQRVNMHFGMNALIRVIAFYRNESEDGKSYFGQFGLPDEASALFGELYWLHLKGLPINEDVVSTAIDRNNYWFSSDEIREMAKELYKSYREYLNA